MTANCLFLVKPHDGHVTTFTVLASVFSNLKEDILTAIISFIIKKLVVSVGNLNINKCNLIKIC